MKTTRQKSWPYCGRQGKKVEAENGREYRDTHDPEIAEEIY
jgi:hypothetical protein